MHGYDDFFKDVEIAFQDLILKRRPKIILKSDKDFGNYAVELCFKNSKLTFDLDRMNLQCNLINIKDLSEYSILKIVSILHPEKQIKFFTNEVNETRTSVVDYLNFLNDIIEKYLTNVLDGDFTWSDQYITKAKEESTMIKRVLDLEPSDIIYQKFWKGDESWKDDLLLRFKQF